jgi:hypothetical protein
MYGRFWLKEDKLGFVPQPSLWALEEVAAIASGANLRNFTATCRMSKMSVWNLQELRELIKKIHGAEQLSKAAGHINSVDWRIQQAGYHSYMASNAFSSVFEGAEHELVSAVRMMLSTGEEVSKFNEAKFIYEANVIACAQAMHAVADIISHVILDALAIKGLNEEKLSIQVIQTRVPPGRLKEKIVRVSGLKEFRYLQDFVNTAKHVSLVDSSYTVDLTGREKHPHGIRFKEFECKDRPHPAKWGADFLKELRQLSIEYVNLGQELNVLLSKLAS